MFLRKIKGVSRLRSKQDGWRKEVETQGTETGKLAGHEWGGTTAAGGCWAEQRSPSGSRQVCSLNEWGKLEQSLHLHLGAFLNVLVCIPFGGFLLEQRSEYFK